MLSAIDKGLRICCQPKINKGLKYVVSQRYVNCQPKINLCIKAEVTSVGEERANLSAAVYL